MSKCNYITSNKYDLKNNVRPKNIKWRFYQWMLTIFQQNCRKKRKNLYTNTTAEKLIKIILDYGDIKTL